MRPEEVPLVPGLTTPPSCTFAESLGSGRSRGVISDRDFGPRAVIVVVDLEGLPL